jgi:hypothetical protein
MMAGRSYPPKKVLICGSRFWNRPLWIRFIVGQLKRQYGDNTVIIHGAAKGVDRIAGQAAKEMDLEVREYPADWSKGRYAGFVRNEKMHDTEKPDLVIAIGNGRGTDGMCKYASSHGTEVIRRYTYGSVPQS